LSFHSAAMESSRIFVRGLPPKFTEDDVRKHFSKFPVTDVKFFPHRRIGYVGYKTPEDAAKAVKYFNKTFIKLTKIFVETARPVSLHAHCLVVDRGADVDTDRRRATP
jgi:multiple RNA-binding domain-containing protein 1